MKGNPVDHDHLIIIRLSAGKLFSRIMERNKKRAPDRIRTYFSSLGTHTPVIKKVGSL